MIGSEESASSDVEAQRQFVFVSRAHFFSTLLGSCGVSKAELSLEIDLILFFVTARDNPCHASVPTGITMAETQPQLRKQSRTP